MLWMFLVFVLGSLVISLPLVNLTDDKAVNYLILMNITYTTLGALIFPLISFAFMKRGKITKASFVGWVLISNLFVVFGSYALMLIVFEFNGSWFIGFRGLDLAARQGLLSIISAISFLVFLVIAFFSVIKNQGTANKGLLE